MEPRQWQGKSWKDFALWADFWMNEYKRHASLLKQAALSVSQDYQKWISEMYLDT